MKRKIHWIDVAFILTIILLSTDIAFRIADKPSCSIHIHDTETVSVVERSAGTITFVWGETRVYHAYSLSMAIAIMHNESGSNYSIVMHDWDGDSAYTWRPKRGYLDTISKNIQP